MAGSTRQLKFSKLIREELSDIFQKKFQGAFQGGLVTLSDIEMSPDLGFAKVFISIFPINQTERVMDTLNANKSAIRGALGKGIGKQIRVVPELAFFADATAEEADRIDKIIDNLVIPPEDDID